MLHTLAILLPSILLLLKCSSHNCTVLGLRLLVIAVLIILNTVQGLVAFNWIYTNIDAPAGSTELREVLSHPLTRMTEVRAQPRGQSALAGGSTL